MVKISLKFYNIFFMHYSTTLSIKKQTPLKNLRRSKIGGGGGSRVGMNVVKDPMFFLKASLKEAQKSI